MQRWEYLVVRIGYPGGHERVKSINGKEIPDWKQRELWDVLSELGSEGWELVTIQIDIYIFKRPEVQ